MFIFSVKKFDTENILFFVENIVIIERELLSYENFLKFPFDVNKSEGVWVFMT